MPSERHTSQLTLTRGFEYPNISMAHLSTRPKFSNLGQTHSLSIGSCPVFKCPGAVISATSTAGKSDHAVNVHRHFIGVLVIHRNMMAISITLGPCVIVPFPGTCVYVSLTLGPLADLPPVLPSARPRPLRLISLPSGASAVLPPSAPVLLVMLPLLLRCSPTSPLGLYLSASFICQ